MAIILADNIFKCIYLNENENILIQISLQLVPRSPIDNKPALVQVVAWPWTGNKPLPEPMMTQFTVHICGNRGDELNPALTPFPELKSTLCILQKKWRCYKEVWKEIQLYTIICSLLVFPYRQCPGPWFNIKMTSYQYRKSDCGDKTVVISIMRFPILVRCHLYIESGPCPPLCLLPIMPVILGYYNDIFMLHCSHKSDQHDGCRWPGA